MLGDLKLGGAFEHGSSQGTATEQQWLALLGAYLPKRYKAASAFIVNAEGRRSQQIDVAIYDDLHVPPLFPHAAGVHVPIEAVYAVFEVKPIATRQWLRDAGEKVASVRALRTRGTKRQVLGGLLTTYSRWTPDRFAESLGQALQSLPTAQRIDLGCALEHASFENDGTLTVSRPDEALIFFILRLVERLNAMGPPPALNLMRYVRSLESFQRWA
jgi:hypothetical protein